MRNKICLAFVVAILSLFLVPMVTFDGHSIMSEKEKRNLAKFPDLFVENKLNRNIFSDFDAYFEDRFGGREYLISINNYVNYRVNSRVNQKAIRGQGDWGFYISKADGDNLSDFLKRNLMSEDALRSFREDIQNTVNWCRAQNIPCIFLIGPNKHSVYPEFYPFERPEGQTRADQLTGILQDVGASFVFPRDGIILAKSKTEAPLYYETDTHWNPLGAFVAYEQLLAVLQGLFPNHSFPTISYDTKIEYSTTFGDILPMLGVEEGKSTQPQVFPKDYRREELYAYIKNEGAAGVHTKSMAPDALRALVFRDSFFSALEPFVSPLFSETEYIWRKFRESDKEYVLEYKPDVIIFESVERHFPSICSGIQ